MLRNTEVEKRSLISNKLKSLINYTNSVIIIEVNYEVYL